MRDVLAANVRVRDGHDRSGRDGGGPVSGAMLHGLGDCTPELNCGCIGTGDGYRDVSGTFHPNPPTVGILVSICVRCAAYVATTNKDIHDEWHRRMGADR